MQVLMFLFSLLVKLILLARTYWPVVTVAVAFAAKLASGDTSGLTEAFAAIVAAIAAVRGGARAAKAENALRAAREAAERVAVGGYSLVKSNGEPLGDNGPIAFVFNVVPDALKEHPKVNDSGPPFPLADVGPYLGIQPPEAK